MLKIALILSPSRRWDRNRIASKTATFTPLKVGRLDARALDGKFFQITTAEEAKAFNDRVLRLSQDAFILDTAKGFWPQLLVEEAEADLLKVAAPESISEALSIASRVLTEDDTINLITLVRGRLREAQDALKAELTKQAEAAAELAALAAPPAEETNILPPVPPGPDDDTGTAADLAPASTVNAIELPDVGPEAPTEAPPSPEAEAVPEVEPESTQTPEVTEVRTLPALPPVETEATPAPKKRGPKPKQPQA